VPGSVSRCTAGLWMGAAVHAQSHRHEFRRPEGDQPTDEKPVHETSHVKLHVRLLGEPQLTCDGIDIPVTPACLRLLAFVLTRPGRRATKGQMAATLGEPAPESAARHRLNTAIWRLRGALETAGAPRDSVLVSTPTGLAILPDCNIDVDVVEFDRACRAPLEVSTWTGDVATSVQRGLALYGGDFMEGVYDEWALAERGRLAEIRLSALLRLAKWHERSGDPDAAVHFAECAAATEPLREDLQRLLMRQYRRAGMPEMAAQHYHSLRALLWAELGVEPLPETREAGLGGSATPAGRPEPTTSKAVRDALVELERVHAHLRSLTTHVDNLIKTLRTDPAVSGRRQ
jgi:DNA-binding SARP family transcriptional activator